MSLKNCVKLMFCSTLMALVYTHMQMQIFELAYKGKDKEKLVRELMEYNGALTHQILALKSANHLGQQLLEKEDGLQFIGNERVMTLSRPVSGRSQGPTIRTQLKLEAPKWNILSFLGPQEARAWEH